MRIRTDNLMATAAGAGATGFWGRIGRLLGRDTPTRPGKLVQVWDGSREVYRLVDLNDRNDPLWDAARSIAGASRTAA